MAANKEMAGLKKRISARRNTCLDGAKTGCQKSCGAVHLERLNLYSDKEGPETIPGQASSSHSS